MDYIINGSTLSNIGNAIRAKKGTIAPILTEQMADEIRSIVGGSGIVPTGTLEITKEGVYDVTDYKSVSVWISNLLKFVPLYTVQYDITQEIQRCVDAEGNQLYVPTLNDEDIYVMGGLNFSDTIVAPYITMIDSYDTDSLSSPKNNIKKYEAWRTN